MPGKFIMSYNELNWQDKKIMGDQFISSIDSIGANIAEGFGRYHYLDKNKFNYNARGSLLEAIYWIDILKERGRADSKLADVLKFNRLLKKSFFSQTRPWANKSKILSAGLPGADRIVFEK